MGGKPREVIELYKKTTQHNTQHTTTTIKFDCQTVLLDSRFSWSELLVVVVSFELDTGSLPLISFFDFL